MEELEKSTKDLLESYKRRVERRKLYFHEWVEYYYLLKESINLGLSKEMKNEFLNVLLNDDFIEVNEENKEAFNNMKNDLCFGHKTISRIKTK